MKKIKNIIVLLFILQINQYQASAERIGSLKQTSSFVWPIVGPDQKLNKNQLVILPLKDAPLNQIPTFLQSRSQKRLKGNSIVKTPSSAAKIRVSKEIDEEALLLERISHLNRRDLRKQNNNRFVGVKPLEIDEYALLQGELIEFSCVAVTAQSLEIDENSLSMSGFNINPKRQKTMDNNLNKVDF